MGVFIAVKFIFAHKILQGNIDERVKYARYEEGPLRISRIEEAVSKCSILFEPVEAKRRSRSSGTQISGKRGRFEIGSEVI